MTTTHFGQSVSGQIAKQFDADVAGVVIPWHESFSRIPFTVEAWAKVPAMESSSHLVALGPPTSGDRWHLAVTAKGQMVFETSGYSPWSSRSQRLAGDGDWHHWAITLDGERLRFFIDGAPAGDALMTANQQPKPVVSGPLVIGTDIRPFSPLCSAASIRCIRLSNAVRDFSGIPLAKADDITIGLWRPGECDTHNVVRNEAADALHGIVVAGKAGISLDEIDRRSFNAGPSPMAARATPIQLRPGRFDAVRSAERILLDGIWQMVCDGDVEQRLAGSWNDVIPAFVPGSVHTALEAAGCIPNPKVGKNDAPAREMSFKTWWLRTTFKRPPGEAHRLIFDGIAIRCSVWLNGHRLGDHEGMFGGPYFDIVPLLQDDNELIVKIDPAGFDRNWFWDSNASWRSTVVFNCVYGWHYSDIPALGIWRSVRIEAMPAVKICDPFVVTIDPYAGKIDLRVDLQGHISCNGVLRGVIEPKNFTGGSHTFELPIQTESAAHLVRLITTIANPRLWWPNGAGEPNLYRLRLQFVPEAGLADVCEITFGLRTIEMRPLPDGPHPKRYNWTFVINNRPMFVKGSGWCTMDSSMDFRRERYERFLLAAKQEHCQMLRAWGGGMPETDDFYDLCDELGIMVMQEWPTAWNSHTTQPFDVLEETVRLNTLRLRNRASLVMWGAGNESNYPEGAAIDMMGRMAIELDGTRPFHRGEAWGGSEHNYDCWWDKAHLNHNLTMTSRFWGEFGVPSMPNYASVQRYLPDDEKTLWPPPRDGSFWHHTPVFNRAGEQERFEQYAGYFTAGVTMQRFILGTQLAQVVGARHTLERARTRWPDCSGALLYKLNDNYPAGSWSTVDWYGATKPAHWFVRSAFAPVHACVLLESLTLCGETAIEVYLLDDHCALAGVGWDVVVRVYDADLHVQSSQRFIGNSADGMPRLIGKVRLTREQTESSPLLILTDVYAAGQRVDRAYYFLNFEGKPDCLFDLPPTTLMLRKEAATCTVTNTGSLPAIGVSFHSSRDDVFEIEDNYLWLDAGESRTLCISRCKSVSVTAWNTSSVAD